MLLKQLLLLALAFAPAFGGGQAVVAVPAAPMPLATVSAAAALPAAGSPALAAARVGALPVAAAVAPAAVPPPASIELPLAANDPAAAAPAVPAAAAARTAPASLAALFDGTRIGTVFDGDTGPGTWQLKALDTDWARSATVVGFDLPSPIAYVDAPELAAKNPGATTLTTRVDPRFPEAGTVDVAHVGFMHMQSSQWRVRLKSYRALVRPGGYFLVSHNTHYGASLNRGRPVPAQQLAGHFKLAFEATREWELVAEYGPDDVPQDYPKTDWWERFASMRGRSDLEMPSENFLLVFRRRELGPAQRLKRRILNLVAPPQAD